MDFQIENIKEIMDNLDLGALLPNMDSVLGFVDLFVRLAVMAAPLAVLGLGLYFFLAAPKEATHAAGYRFRWGMGSVEAWQFTQRLAGIVWGILGLGMTVTMAIIATSFGRMEVMSMLGKAVTMLIWEAALILISCIAIDITVFARFDLKGHRRISWKELFQA